MTRLSEHQHAESRGRREASNIPSFEVEIQLQSEIIMKMFPSRWRLLLSSLPRGHESSLQTDRGPRPVGGGGLAERSAHICLLWPPSSPSLCGPPSLL